MTAPTPDTHEFRGVPSADGSVRRDFCRASIVDGRLGGSPVHRYCGLPAAQHPAAGAYAYAPAPAADAPDGMSKRQYAASVDAIRLRVAEALREIPEEREIHARDGRTLLDALDAATAKLAEIEALAAGADRDDHGLHCAEPVGGPCECWVAVVLAIIRRQA